MSKCHQDFWARWSSEYLHTLNQRSKWNTSTVGPELGTLVLIKHENYPPLKWHLGRVIKLHLGPDNLCRVVTLRTARGDIQRPVNKLCPLSTQ